MKRLKINTCNKSGNYLSFSSQRLIPETRQDNYLLDQLKQPNFPIQFRGAPNTDAMLAIIQFQLIDTVQQSFLDGIFKPISNNYPSFLQMASLSPFPPLHFDECKFTGTLVSNPLLPSSHEG